ncbi:MAG: nucleotidyl transferase AbiEii/AbiGii toxin family protein, partial [Thermodesulfobacteriota bacterium]|nr:nucleotidyl transferase AbiEii/AbiGii toxin family protein [Thermodesulfobacteriota bacterium]
KCYGLNRFSEDLDFTSENKIDTKKIENGLKRFNIEYEIKTKEYDNEQKTTLRIKGPLFIGISQSLCKLIIDISLREKVILKPNIKTIGRFLEEIPIFDIFAMQEKEILAEKIRAIMTRSKARDIYDLWFLMDQDVKFDKKLAKEKLKFYKEKWDAKEFAGKIDIKKTIWNNELRYLLPNVPDFQKTKESIIKKMKIQ